MMKKTDRWVLIFIGFALAAFGVLIIIFSL